MNKSSSDGTAVMLLLMLAMSLVAGVGFIAAKQRYFTGSGPIKIQFEPSVRPDDSSPKVTLVNGGALRVARSDELFLN